MQSNPRLKSVILASASAAVIAFGATPAFAQGQPAAPPDTTGEAQTIPGDPEAAAPQTDDAVQTATGADQGVEGEEIVVTGLRRSLQTSQNIKRNSEQIVDVIVAEDIGKLPDRTVSEALARVPGVTVERQSAEAGDVFIRGLRDPSTTYNGREIFTAEARSVAPQDFPAGGVAALEVFKSLTAEQIEGNLAGSINVRSRRAFDFRNPEVAGSFNLTYSDRAEDFGWNGNLLLTDRWDTGAGEVGALLNVSYTELEYIDSARFVSGDFFGINPDPGSPGSFCDNFDAGCLGGAPIGNIPGVTVRTPVGVGLFQSPGNRKRPSANASIQWRPAGAENLEIYVDGLYQGFRRNVSDRLLFVPLFAGSAYTNVVVGQQGAEFGFADSLSVTAPATPDGFQAATDEKTDTYQVAIGAVYDTDRLRLAVDLARTDSQFDLSVASVDYRFNARPNVNVVFDVDRGDGGVEFDLGGFDTTDLSNYLYRGFFDRHLTAEGDDYQFRVDGTLKELTSWIRGIDLGFRYSDRDGGFRDGSRYSTRGDNVPLASLPLDFRIQREGYRGNIQPVRRLVTPTFTSIRNAIPELRDIAGFAEGRPPADPLISYDVNERTLTGYAQLRYNFEGPVGVDGAIGFRVVNTDLSLRGTLPEPNRPFTLSREYTDFLPNASIRARITDQLQVRAAYTETRTRPQFGQLNPGLRLDPPGGSPIRTGRGGNPLLDPIESENYDLSIEYYFARTGFAALALFRRDVENFIIDVQRETLIPEFGLVNTFGPANAGDGRLQGVEAQVRTFFDFNFLPRWVHGFGAELNVTYIDQKLEAPEEFVSPSGEVAFPDVSEWTYNIVGFYEQGPLTARVAYNRRSSYSQLFVQGGGFEFVGPITRLDASISYALTDNITLAADVSNILADPFRNFRRVEDDVVYPRDVRYEERVFSAGLRFRF